MDRIQDILGLLENPAELSDAQVGELEAELLQIFAAIRAGEYEGVEPNDVETLRSVSTGVENLRALAAERYTTAAEVDAQIAELEAQLAAEPTAEGDGDDDTDGDADGDSSDAAGDDSDATTDDTDTEGADTEPVAVSAAAAPTRPSLGQAAARVPAARRPRTSAAPERQANVTIVATQGGQLDSMTAAADAMSRGFRQLGPDAGKRSLVQLRAEYPDSHRLREGDEHGNGERIEAVVAAGRDASAWTDDAVVAAGWCVPAPVSYGLVVQAMADTPVINSLPSMQMDRGGVRVPVSPSLSDIVTSTGTDAGAAIGFWTEDDDDIDAADPTQDTVLKPFQVVDCGDWAEFRAYAVTRSLAWRNMAARANPERVAAFNQLLMAAYARTRETKVLDLIKTDSGTTNVTQVAPVFGAAIDIVELIIRLGASMRSAERTGAQARLRAPLPAWVIDMMAADMVRSGRAVYNDSALVVARNRIVDELANANINPTFYLDSPSTGPSQLLGRQATGEARQWPCSVQFGLWFEGHFVFGDGGEIDLGVYRDTDKIQRNTYATFAESFDSVIANRGPEALWVTQDVVVNGTFSAPIDGDVPECYA